MPTQQFYHLTIPNSPHPLEQLAAVELDSPPATLCVSVPNAPDLTDPTMGGLSIHSNGVLVSTKIKDRRIFVEGLLFGDWHGDWLNVYSIHWAQAGDELTLMWTTTP